MRVLRFNEHMMKLNYEPQVFIIILEQNKIIYIFA